MTEIVKTLAGSKPQSWEKRTRGCRSLKTKVRRWAALTRIRTDRVWANSFLPNEAEREDRLQKNIFAEQKSPMLVDYVQRELADGSRTVVETEHWLAVVPYWAALAVRNATAAQSPRFTDHRFDRRPAQRFSTGVEKADQSL